MEIAEDLDAFALYMKDRVSEALDRRLRGEDGADGEERAQP